MSELKIELCDKVALDFITNRSVSRSILITGQRGGDRHIYIGIDTLVIIGDFLRTQGIKTALPK